MIFVILCGVAPCIFCCISTDRLTFSISNRSGLVTLIDYEYKATAYAMVILKRCIVKVYLVDVWAYPCGVKLVMNDRISYVISVDHVLAVLCWVPNLRLSSVQLHLIVVELDAYDLINV